MAKARQEYRAAGRVVTRRIGSDSLLVPVSGVAAGENAVFPVNEVGLFIWNQLVEGHDVQETVAALVRSFDVDTEEARADCEDYLRRLLEANLLEEVPA